MVSTSNGRTAVNDSIQSIENHRVSTGFNIGFIRDGGKCCFDRETVYIISTSLRDALMEDREEFVEFIDSK